MLASTSQLFSPGGDDWAGSVQNSLQSCMNLAVHGLPISFNRQGGLKLVSVSSWKLSVARSDCVAVSTSVTGCSEKKCSPGSTAAVDCNVSMASCAAWIKAARWASGSVANE